MIKFTDYLYDLLQNSINAEASNITLLIKDDTLYHIEIIDDGFGMDDKTLELVKSFKYTSRTKRSVGLGLSLIHDLAIQTGGYFNIDSKKGFGTTLSLGFDKKHIDFPEMGDLKELILDMYMHQDVKNFIFILGDIKIDLKHLGFFDEHKTYKQRQKLLKQIDNIFMEVANENSRRIKEVKR